MTELLTAAQMKAIEQAAIASGEVTGLELMERAGQGVIDAIFEEWPELKATSHRAVVLCGPGNNGGDGFVVARLLKEWGWVVEVFLYGTPEKMPPDARLNYERWLGMGEVKTRSDQSAEIRRRTQGVRQGKKSVWADDRPKADLIVDALFGIGLTRSMTFDDFLGLQLSDALQSPNAKRVCIDLPSGICANSGQVLILDGDNLPREVYLDEPFDLCVTFHLKKIAHVVGQGSVSAKKIVVIDLGLPPSLEGYYRQYFLGEVTREEILKPEFTLPLSMGKTVFRDLRKEKSNRSGWPRPYATHKYSHGHALIVSGDHGRAGAARLAARGALRIGAGVVTVASPPAAMAENAARLDAIMLREVAGAEDLAGVLADKRINALCLGPGMGTGAREVGVLAAALSHGGQIAHPTVLDADALTLLSQRPDLFAALHEGCVLTPHHGEFARLFPDIAEKLNTPATKGPAYSKVDATREAAARAGCVVLFKGPDTVIADPSGRAAINAAVYDRAAPWLATAGSGDVLAGFITGLLARGFSPFNAACTGAWLHVECARSFGPGLIAEDLPEELPKVFRALGL